MRFWMIGLGIVSLAYILFFDFNGFSTNDEDWVYGIEAFKMKWEGIF